MDNYATTLGHLSFTKNIPSITIELKMYRNVCPINESYDQKYQTIPLFKTENSTSQILLTQILDRSM